MPMVNRNGAAGSSVTCGPYSRFRLVSTKLYAGPASSSGVNRSTVLPQSHDNGDDQSGPSVGVVVGVGVGVGVGVDVGVGVRGSPVWVGLGLSTGGSGPGARSTARAAMAMGTAATTATPT